MQVRLPTMTILPTSYEGKNGKGFNATIFEPVSYNIRFAKDGLMPAEQMQAVFDKCAEDCIEVEIQFKQGQTKFGAYFEIYSVKPVRPNQAKAG